MRLDTTAKRTVGPKKPQTEGFRAEPTQRTPTLLGLDLPMRDTHYPREGYDSESQAPHVSSFHEELPRELIEYDNHVPLIAESGMDRRQYLRKVEDERRSASEEREDLNERLNRVIERETPQEPVMARPTTPGASVLTSSSIFGLNSPTADEIGATEAESTPAEAEHASGQVVTERTTEPARGHFLDFSESPRGSESLHGPSFLGLSSSPEEYEEEAGESHARRNFAFFVLILLAVLIALQWRSIRDFGIKYAQNGGIHIPGMKQAKNDANTTNANQAANNATVSNGSSSANSTNSAAATPSTGNEPNIEVAPTKNPVADAKAADQAGSQSSKTDGTSADAKNQSDSTAKDNPESVGSAAAADGAKDKSEASSKKSSNGDADTIPQGEPAEDSAEASDEEPAAPVKKQKVRQPEDDTAQYGAAELSQANATSDPATKASLLWKSTSKGNPIAPVQLAELYLTGQGVSQDCEQAMVLLRSASAKKNPRARSKLGSLYATGQCVEQDRVQAYHWMSLALQVNPGSEWVERNRESLWAQMTADERRRAGRDR